MDLKALLFLAIPTLLISNLSYEIIPLKNANSINRTERNIELPITASATYVQVYSWYSESRQDNFTTTNPNWRGTSGETKSPDYTFSRVEGLIFNPDNPQPDGTVAVYSWYSPSRGDNFITSDPRWAGSLGDVKTPDYRFVRLEGYAYDPAVIPPNGAAPLYSWYDSGRGDNFATASREWAGFKGVGDKDPNYSYVRREGYVIPYHNVPGGSYNVIPLFFHFQYDHIDANSGLPAYGTGVNMQTMDSIDKAVTNLNLLMDEARGLETRRLQFVRAGVRYQPLAVDDPNLLPLYSWYSPGRNDNLALAHSAWRIDPDDDEQLNSPDYRPGRKEGSIFHPGQPQPDRTVPLYSWYSPSRGDNLITTNLEWDGSVYDRKAPDYQLVRKEGYIYDPSLPQPENTVPLYSWYSPRRADNLASTDHSWSGERGDNRSPDYQFVRLEGYVVTPAGCDLRSSSISIHRMEKAINVLATNACPGVNTSPSTIVATTESLAHEVGHALGLFHLFEGNKNADIAEILHRNLNPNDEDSCYRKGDRTCDTPPDYGYAHADGDLTDVVCGGIVAVPCEQSGPPCDFQELMIDGNGLCRSSGTQGIRSYDAIALGLQRGTSSNVMGYHTHDEFSHEQYLRMLHYSMWRFGLKSQVPRQDKSTFKSFNFGPPESEFWNTSPSNTFQLNNPKMNRNIPMYLSSSSGNNEWTGVVSSIGDNLLNFSLTIAGDGLPSNDTEIQITTPGGRRISIPATNLLLEDGRISFDEIYGLDLYTYRGLQADGRWTVRVLNSMEFTPNAVSLTVMGY